MQISVCCGSLTVRRSLKESTELMNPAGAVSEEKVSEKNKLYCNVCSVIFNV